MNTSLEPGGMPENRHTWLKDSFKSPWVVDGRMEDLVENLHEASIIQRGILRLELEEIDLAALCEETVNSVRQQSWAAGVSIELEIPSSITGYFDPVRIRRALLNLLNNAVNYGLGKPIQVRLEADNDSVRIHVCDHGMGIAPENQERIFELFSRTPATERYEGLGLGLYVARKIACAHGGTIRVASALNAGSVFTLVLPVRAWDSRLLAA